MNEEITYEEQLKSTASIASNYLEKSTRSINELITSLKEDPKRQLEILRKLANQEVTSVLFSSPQK